jgi:hypothetical protein
MGIFYDGPYAEDVNRDAFHEGYAGRLWPDGSITSTWDGEPGSTGHSGLLGACECGWRSDRIRPPGQDDSPEYQAALRDFTTEHLDPLIDAAKRRSWPRWVATVTAQANQVCELVTQGRLDDADDLLRELRDEVARRIPVVAELRAECEYQAEREHSGAVLVFTPLTDVPRPATWLRPAPPPTHTPPGVGHGR